jgi:hypothetical protein
MTKVAIDRVAATVRITDRSKNATAHALDHALQSANISQRP